MAFQIEILERYFTGSLVLMSSNIPSAVSNFPHFPYIEIKNTTSKAEHEASTSKIGEDQLFYCNQRGISTEDAINMIDDSIEQVSELRANMGSFQKNALEANLRNLRVASENLTQAESVLRDSDMAAEMSEFTKNQILLASGTAMSAQANQIPKSVLQLLGSATG